MSDYRIEAAAGCHIGRIRMKNEDNLLFADKTMPCRHKSLHRPIRKILSLKEERLFCVFDGIGGEEYGEVASYMAAVSFRDQQREHRDYLENNSDFLKKACARANRDIVTASEERMASGMGCTVAALLFTEEEVYVCNLGDSKVFRLRDGEWLQLSVDHIESMVPRKSGFGKPSITQYLGVPEDELQLEPYIARGDIRKDDQYLICSDGLTDMLSNVEICSVLKENQKISECIDKLIQSSLQHGGRDNITAILCRVI